LKKIFCWAGPTYQRPVSVLTARDGCSVLCATLFLVVMLTAQRALDAGGRRSSPPHVGWPPLIAAPDIIDEAATHSAPPSHRSGSPPHCSAPHQPPLHPSSPATAEPPLSGPTRPKGAPHHRALCTKRLPATPASEGRQRDAPIVIFLCEHLTGGSLHRLLPHPTDTATSSTPPRSSSRPLLRPPRPLLRPLTGTSSPLAHASPQKCLPR
jgi:hypothetical protein